MAFKEVSRVEVRDSPAVAGGRQHPRAGKRDRPVPQYRKEVCPGCGALRFGTRWT
ncbi:MAG: hypothetical protein HW414_1765, partial [Dehalococcoidia bacterium]|nr:hypothetical protein [Dehalococcoidia bacterium]